MEDHRHDSAKRSNEPEEDELSREWTVMARKYINALLTPFHPLHDHIAALLEAEMGLSESTELTVMDVGTGPGEPALTIAKKLSSTNRKFSLYANDFSSGMIGAARVRLAESLDIPIMNKSRIHFDVADITQMGDNSAPATGTCDAIACSLVLQYVREPDSFLNKIYERLKPGGCFIVVVWKRYREVPVLRAIKSALVSLIPGRQAELQTDADWDENASFLLGDSQKFANLIRKGGFVDLKQSEFLVPMHFHSLDQLYHFIGDAPWLRTHATESKSKLWAIIQDLKTESLASFPSDSARHIVAESPDKPISLPSVASIIVAKKLK